MLFPLEIWINISIYADALTIARIAQSCKKLYELIRIHVEKKYLNPAPTMLMQLDVWKLHGYLKEPITKVCLPTNCWIYIYKDSSKRHYSVKKSELDPHIDLTFPDLRSPNTKRALMFRLLKPSEIEYKCFTSKLNVEIHNNGVFQWWTGTINVMQTPRIKKFYKLDVGEWYFYLPIGKKKESRGYKIKVSKEIFTISALQALPSGDLTEVCQ